MAWDVCIEIPALPDPLELVLPGGISIKHINLEALVQPALAPLGPAFKILDAVMALVDVLTALKDALTSVPPDFGKAAHALGRVAEIPTSLAALLPPVAVPQMLAACLDLSLRTLGQVRGEILYLQQQAVALLTAEKVAHELKDARLLRVVACAKHNVEREAVNVGKGMASLGHLLGLVELFGKLAGQTLQVPSIAVVAGRPLDAAVAPLDAMIDALATLRKTLVLLPRGAA